MAHLGVSRVPPPPLLCVCEYSKVNVLISVVEFNWKMDFGVVTVIYHNPRKYWSSGRLELCSYFIVIYNFHIPASLFFL